jgi:hypothetical protein
LTATHSTSLPSCGTSLPATPGSSSRTSTPYLEASALDDLFGDGGALVAAATEILARLNGHTMIDDAGYRLVRLRNRFVQRPGVEHAVVHDQAVARNHVVAMAGVAEARGAAFAAGVVVDGAASEAPTPEGPRQLLRAAANSDADELLALIGKAEVLDWATLWKAYEIVRDAVGGKDAAVVATGWVTEDDIVNFGHAANEPSASGSAARHARRRPWNKQPTRILSIEEGRQFIRDLARRWLDSLS